MIEDHVCVAAPGGVRAAGVVLAVLEVVGVVAVLVWTRSNPGLMISSLIPFLVGGGLAWVLCRACIVVDVTSEGLLLAFTPIWRRWLPTEEIDRVEFLPSVSPVAYGGLGYRRVPGRTTALLWSGGPAVQITTAQGEQFIVVTPDAERLSARIARST